jgi:hypothetical protein
MRAELVEAPFDRLRAHSQAALFCMLCVRLFSCVQEKGRM